MSCPPPSCSGRQHPNIVWDHAAQSPQYVCSSARATRPDDDIFTTGSGSYTLHTGEQRTMTWEVCEVASDTEPDVVHAASAFRCANGAAVRWLS